MSIDKRSVFTDALHFVGSPLPVEAKRDAVHFAVEPVVAGHYLNSAAHVKRGIDGRYHACSWDESIGLVDPWIKGVIKPGESFYLFVHPRTITSLRHVWEHPDFDKIEGTEDLVSILTEAATAQIEQYLDVDQERLKKFVENERKNSHRSSDSWIWMRNYADSLDVDVDELLEHADTYQHSDWHYWSQGDKFEGEYIPDEFWDHYEDIRGVTVSSEDRGSFFSCSC